MRDGAGLTMAALLLISTASSATARPRHLALFDGHSLAGWEQGGRHSFRVENGMILGSRPAGADHDKAFLCTKASYGDFKLRADFKLEGGEDANTGIQFRTRRLNAASEVSGYQADAGQGFWGNLFDEGRRMEKLARGDQTKLAPVIGLGKWNRYEITALGARIVLRLNGMTTADYVEPDPNVPRRGLICLQVHNGGAMRVYFKNLRLTLLAE